MTSVRLSPLRTWFLAIRPRTLPAAMGPVCVGTALAFKTGDFHAPLALAALGGALLLQIGVNLANDYFDHIRGIDTPERLGPTRVTQSGLIAPGKVKLAMIWIFLATFAVGLYLIQKGGWPIAIIGAVSILAALAYSGGPFPIASHGLGDLFVFIFFGLIAVCGTYYVQALQLVPIVIQASLPPGFLITAILVVNNLRDIQTDEKTGKKTLAVMIGPKWTRLEYLLLLTGAYTLLPVIWLTGQASAWIWLAFATLPMAMALARDVYRSRGRELNRLLARTAVLSLIFSLLFAIGLITG